MGQTRLNGKRPLPRQLTIQPKKQKELLNSSKSLRLSTRKVAPRKLLTALKFASQRVTSSRLRASTPWPIRQSPLPPTLPCLAPIRPTLPLEPVRSTTHSQLTPAQRSQSATWSLQRSPLGQADLSRRPLSAVRSQTLTWQVRTRSASSRVTLSRARLSVPMVGLSLL